MITFGILGLISISIAVWIRNERRQDVLFMVGGIFLLVYSIFIKDTVFIVLQIIFILSTLAELLKLRK
jgi:hypothetical protein